MDSTVIVPPIFLKVEDRFKQKRQGSN